MAIEVDITRSSLNRMGIYAALGVPEVWRFDGQILTTYQLSTNGKYEACEQSLAYPGLPLEMVAEFVRQASTVDDLTLGRSFRTWVRTEVKRS